MKNKADIYKALLDGKTLTNKTFKRCNIKLDNDGLLVDADDGSIAHSSFEDFYNWSIPEPKVEITLADLAAAMGRSAYSPLFYITARKLKLTDVVHDNEKYVKGVYHDEES